MGKSVVKSGNMTLPEELLSCNQHCHLAECLCSYHQQYCDWTLQCTDFYFYLAMRTKFLQP